MNTAVATLFYVHDPMCSWCWGFRNVWQRLQAEISSKVNIEYVLGGLAPDNDQLMPIAMQQTIEATWKQIQREVPGTDFNFDFWRLNQPRRSTYPACRAVLAARKQHPESADKMLLAIQQAYYLDARNPSDLDVLISLAEAIGLDVTSFSSYIVSETCQHDLLKEINFSRDLHVYSFPSLVLDRDGEQVSLEIDYTNAQNILRQII